MHRHSNLFSFHSIMHIFIFLNYKSLLHNRSLDILTARKSNTLTEKHNLSLILEKKDGEGTRNKNLDSRGKERGEKQGEQKKYRKKLTHKGKKNESDREKETEKGLGVVLKCLHVNEGHLLG